MLVLSLVSWHLAPLVSADIWRGQELEREWRDAAWHFGPFRIQPSLVISSAVGRGQLRAIEERVTARRRNFDLYREALGDMPGIGFMPEAPYGPSNRWLTCITVEFGVDREAVRLALEAENIESRPIWKPMHMQPVFKDCRVRGGKISEDLFARGLCLSSGTRMTEEDLKRVVTVISCC